MHNEEKYYTKNNRFISVVLNLNIFFFVCFVLQIERVTRSIYNIYNEGGTLPLIMLKLLWLFNVILLLSFLGIIPHFLIRRLREIDCVSV